MANLNEYDEDALSGSEVDSDEDEDYSEFSKKIKNKPKIKILGNVDSDNEDVEMEDSDAEVEDDTEYEKTFDSVAEDADDSERYALRTLSEEDDEDVRRQKKRLIGIHDEDDEDEYEDEDDDDNDGENYLQKFGESLKTNVIEQHHPELIMHNHQEVEAMCRIVRDDNGNIIDPLHRTMPFLTKFEKARILGERAKQINAGAQVMVPTTEDMIDGYLIALKEYEERKLPMILRRPLPNGGCEYWKFADLEIL